MFTDPPGPPRGRASLHRAGLGWGRTLLAAGQRSPGRDEQGRGPGLEAPQEGLGEGSPLQRVGGHLRRLCAVYKRLSSARWGCHVPQTLGNAPKSPGTAEGALGSGQEQELVCPLPLPLCRRGWRGACWGRACVPGFRSGIRSACQAWGAQAWACGLCSPAASSSPARLPQPARSAAQGPVPTRSLP